MLFLRLQVLIVEELHLLLLRPDGRNESAASGSRMFGEIAAVIVDLALHGRVVVTAERKPVVQVLSTEPTGHPVLDAALQRVAPLSGRRLDSLVGRSKLDPLEEVVASLPGTGAPSQADLTLLAILQAQGAAHAVLRQEAAGASARELKKRIEQLTAGSPAGDAVASAVTALMTASLTPVIVATAIT